MAAREHEAAIGQDENSLNSLNSLMPNKEEKGWKLHSNAGKVKNHRKENKEDRDICSSTDDLQDVKGKPENIRSVKFEATESMAAWCFDVLLSELRNESTKPKPPHEIEHLSNEGFTTALFVSWKKKVAGNHLQSFDDAEMENRGCIGFLEPIPILSIADFALKSGLEDYRFGPISESEFPMLCCTVSLLKDFEVCDNPYAWEVGTHGIIVSFTDKRGKKYLATFLPDVIAKMKLSQRDTLREAVLKSQYRGTVTESFLNGIRVTRYQCTSASVDHDSYLRIYKNRGRASN